MTNDVIRKIVVVGATSAIAEHCTRLWIGTLPVGLILIGRDLGRLEQVAADLRVRNPSADIRCVAVDMLDAATIAATIGQIAQEAPIDTALIAHGSLPDQSSCEQDLDLDLQALSVNGISPALFAEAFAKVMVAANRGSLVIIGSVAGDRGRRSNYVYGSAKAMLERYAQGLQHRLASTNVRVTLVKPGPTDTPMTAHLKNKGTSLASVESVAQAIVDGSAKGKPVIYAPAKWALIMLVIKLLPRGIFNRMDI